jgi:WD40 repeat protein
MMKRNCPYQDCESTDLPPEARVCPACGRPVYLMGGHDYTALIVDRTRDFTGRGWVFSAIDQWLADPAGKRVFFLGGDPGSGKTAVAARLVQIARGEVSPDPCPHLARAGLAYYHFCQAQDDAAAEPTAFVVSLVLALANSYPAYALVMARMSESHPEIRVQQRVGLASGGEVAAVRIGAVEVGGLSARSAFTHLVAGPLQALAQSGACSPILILVDALDEALTFDPHENIVTLLADITGDLGDLSPQVRFLVTGSLDRRVLALMGGPSLDLVADAPPDIDDVYLYALSRLSAVPESTHMGLADQHGIAAQIAKVGNGNLLYARYVLDDLDARPAAWADQPAQVEATRLALPQGLDDVYRQFIKRELARNEERWTERYAPLLGLLAAARSPGLTREHLSAASGVSLSRTDDALAALSPYLTGAAPDGPFMLYHQSFREFLVRDPQYGVHPIEAEQALGELCVQAYGEDWAACADDYAVRHTPLHLARAAQGLTHPLQRATQRRLRDALSGVLLDYGWLQAKLDRAGIHALLADLALGPPGEDDPTQKLARALEQSTYVLADDPAQLAPQLLGRQLDDEDWRMQALLARVRAQCRRPCLLPCTATLHQAGALQRALARHTDRVTAVAMTPDGSRAVSASADGTLIAWGVSAAPGARSQEPRTLPGHAKAVYAVAVTPDGRRAISASLDRTLRVWDLERGRKRQVLEGHTEAVTGVAVMPDGKRAISASADATLKVWDLAHGRKLYTLKGHADWVTAVAVTPDGERAVSASWDNTLRVWDLASGEKLHTLKGHSAHVRAVVLTPDGRRAISGSLDRTLKVWDLASGKELGALAGLASVVTDVAVTPDGNQVVCASGDTVKVWDISTLVHESPTGDQAELAVAQDGAADSQADPEGGPTVVALAGHRAMVSSVAVTQDGERVVSAAWDGALKVWDLASGACLATFQADERLTVCAVSPDGRTVVAGGESGRMHILQWEE